MCVFVWNDSALGAALLFFACFSIFRASIPSRSFKKMSITEMKEAHAVKNCSCLAEMRLRLHLSRVPGCLLLLHRLLLRRLCGIECGLLLVYLLLLVLLLALRKEQL